MTKTTFTLNETEDSPEGAEIVRSLIAFNVSQAGPSGQKPFVISAHDDTGDLLGGAKGHTHWGWLFVSHLWVSEKQKGSGLGTQLMARVEALAQERGCQNIWLDTYSFQARPFYEKLGFVVFAQLEDYPAGATKYFLRKKVPALKS